MRALAAMLVGLVFALSAPSALAAETGQHASAGAQALRFLRLEDPAVRTAVAGAVLLGISCGLLGGFLVVRRLALVGDALSHAVLPGVAAGFLWAETKSPVAIFVGATIAGLLGALVVGWIQRTTRLKEDAALGLVLAGFYAVGICLVTMIQRLPTGNKSGIDKFLFGQAAAIGPGDLWLMGGVAAAAVGIVIAFYKELLVTSFDPAFARAAGFPVRLIHDALMLLLTFAVVSALQAVGVVLVSAMLITPAATASLLTDRLHRMLAISAGLGVAAGVTGCFLSFLGNDLPTGPMTVLAAAALFGVAFLFAPSRGLVARWWSARSRAARIARENTLKSIYHALERREFETSAVSISDLADQRRETVDAAMREAKHLAAHGFAEFTEKGRNLRLTSAGLKRASEVVRNHRLWELYLTHDAEMSADRVHDAAEEIEHVLPEEVVRKLDRKLNEPRLDPHGRVIPRGHEVPDPGRSEKAGGAAAAREEK